MFSILLSAFLVSPPIRAEAASAAVLGSISTNGSVSIGSISAPGSGTIFAGDQVETRTGSAVIQYKEGPRVMLGVDSSAEFSSGGVQLRRGQMTFRSGTEKVMVFNASSLRLEPAGVNSSANVVLDHDRASVAVTEGAIRVIDPSGAPLANLEAGESRLFAMAAAPAAASPAAPAAAPQAPEGRQTIWALVLGGAGFATTFGLAAAWDNDVDEIAELVGPIQSQAAALQVQLNNTNTQLAGLRSQTAQLSSQVSPSSPAGQQLAAIATQLEAAQTQRDNIQNQLNSLLQQLTAAVASGNTAAISSIATQIQALQTQLNALQTTINNLAAQLGAVQIPPVSP
jgi:hypothetical protein